MHKNNTSSLLRNTFLLTNEEVRHFLPPRLQRISLLLQGRKHDYRPIITSKCTKKEEEEEEICLLLSGRGGGSPNGHSASRSILRRSFAAQLIPESSNSSWPVRLSPRYCQSKDTSFLFFFSFFFLFLLRGATEKTT